VRYNRYIKHILNRKLGGYVYEKGDLIIYGNQSVCRIENIGVISIGKQPNSRKYYTLNPIFMDGKTYVPIDTQVYMRHLISIEELERLLTRHPKVQKEIIEKANNFFDKKGLIQNITIIAVFVNLLLLFFIFVTLLIRG